MVPSRLIGFSASIASKRARNGFGEESPSHLRDSCRGCAYCIDMHTKDARQGETEQRVYALNAWRETPFYTDRERAALEWTEQLTLIAGRGVRAWRLSHA